MELEGNSNSTTSVAFLSVAFLSVAFLRQLRGATHRTVDGDLDNPQLIGATRCEPTWPTPT